MDRRIALILFLLTATCQLGARAGAADRSSGKNARLDFARDVAPLLQQYCYDCHGNGKKKGGLALDAYPDDAARLADRQSWDLVRQNVTGRVMPPEGKPQPSDAQREAIAGWIDAVVFHCDCTQPDPGRVTIRRLNRVEYNNTIRDLLGVDFQPAADFPADDLGYGFDNIGDVLSLPPILMEKYLAAAEKILHQAIVTDTNPPPRTRRFAAGPLPGSAPGEALAQGARALRREGDIYVEVEFPVDGEYVLRARAYGEQAGTEPPRLALLLDGKELRRFDVPVEENAPQVYETRVPAAAGKRKISAAYLNNFVNPRERNPKRRDRNLIVEYLEVVAPGDPPPRPLPESHRRIFTRPPTPENRTEVAREIIGRFARRAFRRPVTNEELDRLMRLFALAGQEGESFEKGVKLALQAILVSPHFLFRGELQPEPDNPKAVHPINEFALASRLSYFLWSTMPDDALFAEAGRGTLRRNLEAQVRRMLKDPKARALVDNFAGQWLQIRNLVDVTPDPATFPDFDEPLRAAMRQETELFVEHILRQDRSVLEFLDADYTFVNERLAKHYGLPGIQGDAFQRVSLKGRPRGGVLTHASVLTLTSNPTRTSPVKRGKWVLETILGAPPPPPPPDVPELKEDQATARSGSLRQRMEQHRENPLCASCHARMDPIGFGLENFDGIGAWRDRDGAFAINPAGELTGGEAFSGPAELKRVLLKRKREEFVRCLAGKLLTYALGRGLEFYDKCAVDDIVKGLGKDRYRFSRLVLEVVGSTPFQQRRGEGD